MLHKERAECWLAGVQSQDPIKSSVECAPVYKEAEITAKNRNDTLKLKICSNFHQACDTYLHFYSRNSCQQKLRKEGVNYISCWPWNEKCVSVQNTYSWHFRSPFCFFFYSECRIGLHHLTYVKFIAERNNLPAHKIA